MKPNTAVITLDRLKELEKYEEAINKRESLILQSDYLRGETKLYVSDELANQSVKEFSLEMQEQVDRLNRERIDLKFKIKKLEKENKEVLIMSSDLELEDEVLRRMEKFYYRNNFHKLREYFRDGFIDEHMITTLSVWEFLRWKKKKKKESISFKLP